MSENNNRPSGRPADQPLTEKQSPPARSPEDILAQVDSFAAEMLNNMLSDLAASTPPAPAPEPIPADEQPVPVQPEQPEAAEPVLVEQESPVPSAPMQQPEAAAEPEQPVPAAVAEEADPAPSEGAAEYGCGPWSCR